MDLEFSEEQLALRDMVRGVCAEFSPLETVRAMEDDPRGVPDELWKQFGDLGLLGMVVPEAYGGSGQGMLEAAILHEELGRALVPAPVFESGMLAVAALLGGGTDAQRKALLPQLASGDATIIPAWLEPKGGFGAQGIQTKAERAGNGWTITGAKRHVPYARVASQLLVLARTGSQSDEIGLFFVDPNAAGVAMSQVKVLGSETQYDLDLTGAPAELLGTDPAAGFRLWEQVMLEGVIALAARANGGCDRALEMTVQYAKDREQFGKPLGAFQSLAHYMADALTKLDGSKTLVHQAAWAQGEGRDIRRLAPMAKLFACQTFRDVSASCQQIWGGVGFTVEYDIQLYFRRAKQLQISWWDTRALEERIAADVLDR